jgi:hypothetical protein
MRPADFEAMIQRMARELPSEYLDGVAEVVVSPKTVPHPVRGDIYTLGECIPLPAVSGDPDAVQSRVVLYHGSFQALAALDPDFDWREEAWETLTHEVRHHLEWRAQAPDLEALDEAAEANYARQDGAPFDPLFFHGGERVVPGVYRIEDDYFVEQVVRRLPGAATIAWHGRAYDVPVPPGASCPVFLTLDGVQDPPPGELILVLRRRPRLRDLFRPSPPFQAVAAVRPAEAMPG